MPAARNHYQILNVAPDAEAVVIEAAYRALMKRYHPDQATSASGDGAPTASEINLAFATLRDAGRRADYDRREWTKGQDIQLAAYRAPPPQRVSRVFGWGGWVVASILGGMLAVLAGRSNDTLLARADAARGAASAEPDLRSQPSFPDEPFTPPAALADPPPAPAAAETVQARMAAPAQEAAPAAEPRPQPKAIGAKPRRPQAQPRRARTAREKDFLEREGYIY
ncbi:MAG TPA: J domain-containing protein [Allosphingosinicella sp.]|jgi:curved DNA-binding protein CbpA